MSSHRSKLCSRRCWTTSGVVSSDTLTLLESADLSSCINLLEKPCWRNTHNKRGSVVVDYKIYFNNLAGRLTTRDILRLFRQNLLLPSIPPLATGRLENSTGELLQLGKLIIDAAYTYFYVLESSDVQLASGVISDSALTHDSEQPSKYLIPEWLIAAIVVGMTALLFMVVFAVLVLWSRRKRTRLRSTVPLTIDMLDQLDKAGRMQPPVAGISGDPVDPSSVDPYVDDGDDAWDDSKVRQRQYRRCLSKARLSPLTTSVDSSVYDSWGSDCSVAGRRPRVLRTTRAMAPGTDSDEF